MAAYQEQLFFYVFGQLATLGKDDPKEMLKVVYAVLSDKKDDIEKLFFPIVSSCIDFNSTFDFIFASTISCNNSIIFIFLYILKSHYD